MKLAINGGKPVRTIPFPPHKVITQQEKKAVNRVLDSGVLSRYLGCWHKDFFGGPEVQKLEEEWASYFKVKHAIAVNSCTSGLYCAVGASGVEPGDEIIVSPYTMAASATAALIYNAVPVFADIEEDYYCLDPKSIEERITDKTKAIIVVDLFGLPYDAHVINEIATKHNLLVIEDCAQAPGSFYRGQHSGTLGDIGVYSLNYHKHIHCGEGGMVVTDDDELADRVRLIRNHAEAVIDGRGSEYLINMIGFNFRLPEIEAAILRCQLRKLKELVEERQKNCEYLASKISTIPAITGPALRNDCTNAFYVQAFKFDSIVAGCSRNSFIDAVRAELPLTTLREGEGPLVSSGYSKPLYLLPMYQSQIAYGSNGFPFKSPWNPRIQDYRKGICPTAERMFESELFSNEQIFPGMKLKDLNDVVDAFFKVWELKETL
jgi:dTDP-4-amino-4,6-dideoxygalactose transaminase